MAVSETNPAVSNT